MCQDLKMPNQYNPPILMILPPSPTEYFPFQPSLSTFFPISFSSAIFCHFIEDQIRSMQGLVSENEKLQQSVEVLLEEIQNQKDLNRQHEAEIETLLKFNERLLSIIETEMHNKNDNQSLRPISERSERDSDLIAPTLQSLIASKRLAARNQIAVSTTNSLIGARSPKLTFDKQGRKSEIDHSFDNDQLSLMRLQQKSANPPVLSKTNSEVQEKRSDIGRKGESSSVVKQELSIEIDELKKFKQESMQFYDQKINQIRGLSSRLNSYQPSQQLKKITNKLSLSSGTSELLKKVMQKGGK